MGPRGPCLYHRPYRHLELQACPVWLILDMLVTPDAYGLYLAWKGLGWVTNVHDHDHGHWQSIHACIVTPDAYDFTVGSTITTTYSAY